MATQTPDKVKKISQREKAALSFWGPQAAVYFGASQSFIYLLFFNKTWVGGFHLMSDSPRPFSKLEARESQVCLL